MEFWTKESTEELIDMASILEPVDSDGWVLLSITEQHHHEMWRDWKWRQLEEPKSIWQAIWHSVILIIEHLM